MLLTNKTVTFKSEEPKMPGKNDCAGCDGQDYDVCPGCQKRNRNGKSTRFNKKTGKAGSNMSKQALTTAKTPVVLAQGLKDLFTADQIDQITERLTTMPRKYRLNYQRALKGNSKKAAIKAHCLECVCWQEEKVRLCTSPACPLYLYRPYKRD